DSVQVANSSVFVGLDLRLPKGDPGAGMDGEDASPADRAFPRLEYHRRPGARARSTTPVRSAPSTYGSHREPSPSCSTMPPSIPSPSFSDRELQCPTPPVSADQPQPPVCKSA